MTSEFTTCALCPRLCRSACPVATGAGREAAVPTWIASVLRSPEVDRADAVAAVTLCVDCGACQDHCHLDEPLPASLRRARARLLPPPDVAEVASPEGEGTLLAVESDPRPWAGWLARELGRPVRRWRTADRFGVAAVEHHVFARHAARLRAVAGDLDVVVADGGVAHALEVAGVRFSWLHEVVPATAGDGALGSCRAGRDRPLACCGGAGPLADHHPDDADRVARMFHARGGSDVVLDARCKALLTGAGAHVTDPVDRLRQRVSP